MKVEIKISAEVIEPCAVIYTNEITAEISRIASFIEDSADNSIITVTDNERMFVLRPEEVYMLRVENERPLYIQKTRNTTAINAYMNLKQYSAAALSEYLNPYWSI